MDSMHTYRNLAKVRVAGSNPVFRSKQKRRSGTPSRVPVLFPGGGFAHHFGVSCHSEKQSAATVGRER